MEKEFKEGILFYLIVFDLIFVGFVGKFGWYIIMVYDCM